MTTRGSSMRERIPTDVRKEEIASFNTLGFWHSSIRKKQLRNRQYLIPRGHSVK